MIKILSQKSRYLLSRPKGKGFSDEQRILVDFGHNCRGIVLFCKSLYCQSRKGRRTCSSSWGEFLASEWVNDLFLTLHHKSCRLFTANKVTVKMKWFFTFLYFPNALWIFQYSETSCVNQSVFPSFQTTFEIFVTSSTFDLIFQILSDCILQMVIFLCMKVTWRNIFLILSQTGNLLNGNERKLYVFF